MKVSIILGHPDQQSFNHAIANECRCFLEQKGHFVYFHDLYAEQFDPVLPSCEISRNGYVDTNIRSYCDEIAESDAIIVVHPNWWGQPPAILKGWVDRVIRPGVAYGFCEGDNGEGVPEGLLKAQFAIVFNTSNTSAEREDNLFLDPLETLWKNCIWGLCGVTRVYRKMFRIVVTSTQSEREAWLEEAKEILATHF